MEQKLEAVEEKVRSIEENYKVNVDFGIKDLGNRNLESLKELAPVKIDQQ